MIKKIIRNNKEIIVNSLEEKNFLTKFKKNKTTLIINYDFVLKYSDRIVYECENCGIEYKEVFRFNQKFILKKTCLCSGCKSKQTKLEKYGDENFVNTKKIKQTKLKKYGDENYNNISKSKQTKLKKYGNSGYNNPNKIKTTQNKKYGGLGLGSKVTRNRIEKTNIDRYGVKNVFKSKDVIEKIKQTNLSRYGAENPFMCEEIKERIKQTNLDRYDSEHFLKSNLGKEKLSKTKKMIFFESIKQHRVNNAIPLFNIDDYNGCSNEYLWKCLKCNTEFYSDIDDGKLPRCPNCYPYKKSIEEQNILNFCNTLSDNVVENNREIIKPYEVDVYLPDYSLAIEYNGLYWHSTLINNDAEYHQRKIKMCDDIGVRLLHIWENDWLEKQNEIKQKIRFYVNNKNIFIKNRKPKLMKIKNFDIWY